jgi:ABC-2 type transport system ATP-binding protein
VLRLIVGLEDVSSGRIIIKSESQAKKTDPAIARVHYVPDDLLIYPFLSGNEFFSWVSKARSSTIKEMNDVVDRLEIRAHLNTYISDMSFGTKKKFLLATALIGSPDFIVLDEPFNGLDEGSQQVLLDILKEKSACSGIIFSTHHESNIALLEPLKIRISNCQLVELSDCVK